MKLTYIEAITHVRKYKKFIRVGAIADDLGINQGQLRQIINRVSYAQELPEKYRAKFIEVVKELTSVRQEVPNDLDDERITFLRSND